MDLKRRLREALLNVLDNLWKFVEADKKVSKTALEKWKKRAKKVHLHRTR